MLDRRLFAGLGAAIALGGCGAATPPTPGKPITALPQDRQLTATDVAGTVGLAQSQPIHTWSTATVDYDGDGAQDLLLIRHLVEPGDLYQNRNDHFHVVDAGTFTTRDRHFCTFGDVNRDGRVDAFCSLGADRGTGAKTDELWMQQPDHTFVDRAAAYGVTDPYGRGRYATFLDVNHDRYPDLFLGNAAPRQDDRPSPDRLYINVGGRRFRDAPEYGLDREQGSFCAQAADFNGDGWTDLFTCSNTGLRLVLNEQGKRFADATDAYGVVGNIAGITAPQVKKSRTELVNRPQPPWSAARIVDLNGDNRLDLVAIAANGIVVQIRADKGFGDPVIVGRLASGFFMATGDVDGDGAPDLYVGQTCRVEGHALKQQPSYVLRNDGSGRHFTRIAVPTVSSGCPQWAAPPDPDGDGKSEFIVLNGRDAFTGPVQVLAFRRIGS